MIKKLILAALGTAYAALLFWLSGFDFDQRGRDAVACAVLMMCGAGAGVSIGLLFEGFGNE